MVIHEGVKCCSSVSSPVVWKYCIACPQFPTGSSSSLLFFMLVAPYPLLPCLQFPCLFHLKMFIYISNILIFAIFKILLSLIFIIFVSVLGWMIHTNSSSLKEKVTRCQNKSLKTTSNPPTKILDTGIANSEDEMFASGYLEGFLRDRQIL